MEAWQLQETTVYSRATAYFPIDPWRDRALPSAASQNNRLAKPSAKRWHLRRIRSGLPVCFIWRPARRRDNYGSKILLHHRQWRDQQMPLWNKIKKFLKGFGSGRYQHFPQVSAGWQRKRWRRKKERKRRNKERKLRIFEYGNNQLGGS